MSEFFITIFAQKSVGKTAAHRKGWILAQMRGKAVKAYFMYGKTL